MQARGENNMASYFVACEPQADGAYPVHDRSRCPPRCFPRDATSEYLGEFLDAQQALAVARLRYRQARDCACAAPLPQHIVQEPVPAWLGAFGALRS
jgi:hypothetical protein